MAKIRPASGKKAPIGPKNPGAVGCLILVGIAVVAIGFVLFYAMGTK